jgi:hypothetical protein
VWESLKAAVEVGLVGSGCGLPLCMQLLQCGSATAAATSWQLPEVAAARVLQALALLVKDTMLCV